MTSNTAARELYTHFSGLQFFGYGAFTSLLYIAGVDAMPESTVIFTVILLAVWSPAFRIVLQILSRHKTERKHIRVWWTWSFSSKLPKIMLKTDKATFTI